jgi:hypothetical protein
MKIASVITASSANALGMRLRSCARRVAYALRSTDDTVGSVAPVSNAMGSRRSDGASATASAMSATRPHACASASHTSTRALRRSIKRAMKGAPSADPSASAPAAAPATPNDLPSCRRNNTVAMPSIPIGIRATIIAT